MTDQDYAKLVGANIRRIATSAGKTQADVSRDLNINKGTVSTWFRGVRTPRIERIDQLCQYFGVERGDLMEPPEHRRKKLPPLRIPVYGRVAAGIPLEMTEEIIDFEELPGIMETMGEFFGLRISGDSMEPKISNGDVVIVKRQPDADSGDIVIAAVNGYDATCKRLRKFRDGIELVSTNPSYKPMFFSNKEIIENPVKILGKVIELRAKL